MNLFTGLLIQSGEIVFFFKKKKKKRKKLQRRREGTEGGDVDFLLSELPPYHVT